MDGVEQQHHLQTARRGVRPRVAAAASLAVGLVSSSVAAGVVGVLPVAPAAASVATINDFIMSADPAPRVVVVDDDGVQCPEAEVASVQEALDRVATGGLVRVCAGRYAEQLTISRPVRLLGQVGPVASVDCVDPAPSALDDLDPTRFAVLEPDPDTGAEPTTPVRIAADDIEIAGFVVQGLEDGSPEQPGPLYDAAVSVGDGYSGTRLHHNLVRLNTLGIELGGSGQRQSRVDHNCFRDNRFAVANQRYRLSNARIDDNTTFRTTTITYEIGWSLAGAATVVVDDNVADDTGFYVVYVENSSAIRVDANEIRTTREGVRVATANKKVVVAGNSIDGAGPGVGVAGIALPSPPAASSASTGVVLDSNRISRMGSTFGRGIQLAPGAQPSGAVITGNTVTDSVEGITAGAGNSGLLVDGNRVERNTMSGIRLSAGTSLNLLTDNTALGNGVDARDLALAATGATATANQWVRTTCATDVPVGAICVPPATTLSPQWMRPPG